MFPIIPILAFAAIAGGLATLAWYADLSREEQKRADGLALKWFGKQFKQLAEHQQKQIQDRINRS